MEMFDFRGKEL